MNNLEVIIKKQNGNIIKTDISEIKNIDYTQGIVLLNTRYDNSKAKKYFENGYQRLY